MLPGQLPTIDQRTAILETASTVADAVRAMSAMFRDAGIETPTRDARKLAEHALSIDGVQLISAGERGLTSADRTRLAEVSARRLAREPVARIEGLRSFFGLDFTVSPDTLDPRPDTETLVEGVLRLAAAGRLTKRTDQLRILDLGTGTGAILIALLSRLGEATGIGVDISPGAIAVARANAARNGVGERVEFRIADWGRGIHGSFDVVVSNPPYIPTLEIAGLQPEVARHDPLLALDGGADGLAAYRRIVADAPALIAPGGWLALEVGAGQARSVAGLIAASPAFGCRTQSLVWQDLGGIERCVAAETRQN